MLSKHVDVSKLTICFSTPEKSWFLSHNAHFDIECMSDNQGAFLNFDETDMRSKLASKFPVHHQPLLAMDDDVGTSTTVRDVSDSRLLTQHPHFLDYMLYIKLWDRRGKSCCRSRGATDVFTSIC